MEQFLLIFKGLDPELRAALTPVLRIIVILVLAWLLQAAASRLTRIVGADPRRQRDAGRRRGNLLSRGPG